MGIEIPSPRQPWLLGIYSLLSVVISVVACENLWANNFHLITKTRWKTVISHTHTHPLKTALCPGLPGWAGTRKVKPIWILLKQETVSGSGISWAICKSAPRSRQITTPAPHHSVFYRPDALPVAQPTASKHWRLKDSDVTIMDIGTSVITQVYCCRCDLINVSSDRPLSAIERYEITHILKRDTTSFAVYVYFRFQTACLWKSGEN